MSTEELKHSKGPKPSQYRIAAVLSAAAARTDAGVDWDQAASNFKSFDKGSYAKGVGVNLRDFLQRWYGNFLDTGNVADTYRSGRPHKLPREEALRAAEIVKRGKWVEVLPKGSGILRLQLFRTIAEAVKESPELQQICAHYTLTADQLRSRIRKADPDLVWATITMKYDHSDRDMDCRKKFCEDMQRAMKADPRGQEAFLQQMVFCDEGSVVLSDREDQSVHVWDSKAEPKHPTVMHMPHRSGHKPCKIHFFIAVSAHPAFADQNGLVYWEFTTGTTALKRHNNKLDEEDGQAYNYQVSCSAF